ncbi:MAG: hypothetical protein M1812_004127 [Candelaria pacifica]|nr:MAG: hypothetical protein M1812_004127 [Candelaria pacifica]
MTESIKIADIPVIDISKPGTSTGDELISAAATSGFVFVKNEGTGFIAEEIYGAFELASFYNLLPISVFLETLDPENQRRGDFKEFVPPITLISNPTSSIIDHAHRALNFGEFVNGKAQQPIPESLIAHEKELSDFADQCHCLCIKILKLFALGLKIDPQDGGEDWFSSRHDPSKGPSGSILRLLHYPALPPHADYIPSFDIRAGAHSDYGSITLLFQTPHQPGLEILTPSQTWASVPVSPPGTENDAFPPILINIGDLLSYWTNGYLKSTVHRVIFPKEARRGGEDRYSIAYFCHPVNDSILVPVPSEIVKTRGNGAKEISEKDVMTAEEHLNSRLAATYGWEKEEKKMD